MAFDLLLKKLGKGKVKIIGFADDGALIIQGKNLKYMNRLMQNAINKAQKWATDSGLTLSPEKTVAMIFTRKRKIEGLEHVKLKLGDKTLEIVDEVKYLGLTLDSKLTFRPHVNNKIKAAKKYIFALRNSIGKEWGPGPEQILWIWEAVVKPTLLYGSLVWAHSLTKTTRNALNKLQRLALMGMGHFRQSTPESGLDVIMGTLPLDLAVLGAALKARIRTKDKIPLTWNGKGIRNKSSHFKTLDDIIADLGLDTDESDRTGKINQWNAAYSVSEQSLQTGEDIKGGLRLYTDGSKMGKKTGYGAILMDTNGLILDSVNGRLSDNATVF